jgi:hypothetical protein
MKHLALLIAVLSSGFLFVETMGTLQLTGSCSGSRTFVSSVMVSSSIQPFFQVASKCAAQPRGGSGVEVGTKQRPQQTLNGAAINMNIPVGCVRVVFSWMLMRAL